MRRDNHSSRRVLEFYRLWCVVVCDLEPSWMGRPWPTGGLLHQNKKERETDIINGLLPVFLDEPIINSSRNSSAFRGIRTFMTKPTRTQHVPPFWVNWAEKRQTYFCKYILIPNKWLRVSAMFLPGSRELGMRFHFSQIIPKAYYIRRHLISFSFCFLSVSSFCFLRPGRDFSQYPEIKDLQSGLKGAFLA